MPKAFLDTTILTDVLLKPGQASEVARRALGRFQSSQLPVYAIKEFKGGPLHNFIWMHNKLVLGSLEDALAALQGLSRTPRRYKTATAIEALRVAAQSEDAPRLAELTRVYGSRANLSEVVRDRWRLALKAAIFRAWKRRRSVASEVVLPLECYTEVAPSEKREVIDTGPTRCKPSKECCLAERLKARPDQLQALRDATDGQDTRLELRRRSRALRALIRTPKREMSEEMCRQLGDAVFAFFCPDDATILTTNLRDHEPLAKALGKRAEAP